MTTGYVTVQSTTLVSNYYPAEDGYIALLLLLISYFEMICMCDGCIWLITWVMVGWEARISYAQFLRYGTCYFAMLCCRKPIFMSRPSRPESGL